MSAFALNEGSTTKVLRLEHPQRLEERDLPSMKAAPRRCCDLTRDYTGTPEINPQ